MVRHELIAFSETISYIAAGCYLKDFGVYSLHVPEREYVSYYANLYICMTVRSRSNMIPHLEFRGCK
jgi:hypothetical protein